MLASGFVDIVIETNLKPHDIVALVPIIEGAGGVVTDWEGGSGGGGRAHRRRRRPARARRGDEAAGGVRWRRTSGSDAQASFAM